ncbi:Por secretion system C-terminal sorting domain-containing protein [Cyclonatronum proteinivorum]|uniref:Por secretion system C-terminal sorting domain-containing protein n=1 Tax=Cyclonatronum proteinivorum TaxID=1457365 RepID=A0A345UPL7_9BACT|nr:zinc-dependent metalloprotease family protein [Cyclonatronum proteinivorum]AXJ02419.1 Por secretion system C-terminal sorting domain-containing protein [Cyclonatronum proteinivorum]
MKSSIPLFKMMLVLVVVLPLFAGAPLQAQQSSDSFWRFTEVSQAVESQRDVHPVAYKSAELSLQNLKTELATAPKQAAGRILQGAQITLPMPDGSLQRFYAVASSVMEEGLAARFPDFKTYRVGGIDDPTAYGRISFTAAGFHGMIRSASGTFYIDPFSAQQPELVMVYNRENYVVSFRQRMGVEQHEPIVHDEAIKREAEAAIYKEAPAFSGTELRTYRLAMAATAQYTTFHSQPNRCATPDDPIACAMAAIVVAMNRVNGLYETEVSSNMVLIDNNEILISTNPSDYANNNGFTMLGQNQARIDNLIGPANYDIGHVFSTGGGGVAALGSVCVNGQKARGVTGLPQPINDPFYIDFVAHEIGHQYNALHTFNGTAGSCGSNRTAGGAYEPGSGSTIMGYAGICGAHNLQFTTDPYFHLFSIIQMSNFAHSGTGSNCGETTPTGNEPPVVEGGLTGLTMPVSTPFILEGSGVDPQGNELVFTWEQFDLGPAGAPTQPVGNAPLFRSFPGNEEPVRMFPRLQNVLSGNPSIGEFLPNYNRNMRFRLSARDNFQGGGGVGFAEVQFAVTEAAGPFIVPVPAQGTNWRAGTVSLVAWDVANTNADPINAETVSIYFSTDGGENFDTILAENVPNNGAAFVTVPDGLNTSDARIKVKADNHIFFNVSRPDFSVSVDAPLPVVQVPDAPIESDASTAEVFEGSFSVSASGGATYNYTVSATFEDLPDGTLPLPAEAISFESPAGFVPSGQSRTINFTVDTSALDEELYAFGVTLTSDPLVGNETVTVILDVRERVTLQRFLSGGEGWRIVSPPVEGATLGETLSNFATQGFPGADEATGEPSVYVMGSTGLVAAPSADYELQAGEALLTYIFGDDLPGFIRGIGFLNRSPFVRPLTNQLIFPIGGAAGSPQQGWNLLGNPYNTAINLGRISEDNLANVSRSFQVWVPSLNGGNGGFIAWNGHDYFPAGVPTGQKFTGQINAFEGFWARARGGNASIVFDQEELTDGSMRSNPFAAYYTFTLTSGDFTSYKVVMFSEDGDAGYDDYDADLLSSVSDEFLYLYSVANNRPRTINSLPLNTADTVVELPMHFDASFAGDLTLSLVNISGEADNFNAFSLVDQVTGETISMGLGDSYTFTFEPEEEAAPAQLNPLPNLPGYNIPSGTTSRFVGQFDLSPPVVNVDEETLDVPTTVELRQNYPNPFNPTTNITFGLPQSGDVRLDVFNVAGQRVATLVNTQMTSGFHTVTFDASRLSSGVYLYRLETNGQVRTEKMTLIK